ncbi:MAG: serine hydrolase [Ornithinibacter sp.]
MTPAPIDRRRLLGGGVAAVGSAVLSSCVRGDTTAPTSSAVPTSTAPTVSATPAPTPTPTPTPTPSVATARFVEAPRLAGRIEDLLDRRGGSLGLEVVDLRRGEAFRVETDEAYCYSTIKVLILATVLRRAQETGTTLTEKQEALAELMITQSDNAATESLLAEVGRKEVRRVADLVGMDDTEIDFGWWGLWRTNPHDLDRLLDTALSSDDLLDDSNRKTVRLLMAAVVPEQRWGVFSAEKQEGVFVAAKNGWGPLPDGFRVNSAGWVSSPDSAYVLSILSRNRSGFSYGRETVSAVADLCHKAVQDGLA